MAFIVALMSGCWKELGCRDYPPERMLYLVRYVDDEPYLEYLHGTNERHYRFEPFKALPIPLHKNYYLLQTSNTGVFIENSILLDINRDEYLSGNITLDLYEEWKEHIMKSDSALYAEFYVCWGQKCATHYSEIGKRNYYSAPFYIKENDNSDNPYPYRPVDTAVMNKLIDNGTIFDYFVPCDKQTYLEPYTPWDI